MEQLWIDGWEALYAAAACEPATVFLDSDWRNLDLEQAKARVQSEAYTSRQLRLEETWWQGRRALRLCFEPA